LERLETRKTANPHKRPSILDPWEGQRPCGLKVRGFAEMRQEHQASPTFFDVPWLCKRFEYVCEVAT